MSTCHALPEAKIQLLNKKAYSVLYYYKEQKIISHLRGIVNSSSTVSCSDGFSLPSNEEAEQEESLDGLWYQTSGRLERSKGPTAEGLIHFLARSCLEAQYTSHHNGPCFFQDYTMNIFCQVTLQKATVYKLWTAEENERWSTINQFPTFQGWVSDFSRGSTCCMCQVYTCGHHTYSV